MWKDVMLLLLLLKMVAMWRNKKDDSKVVSLKGERDRERESKRDGVSMRDQSCW